MIYLLGLWFAIHCYPPLLVVSLETRPFLYTPLCFVGIYVKDQNSPLGNILLLNKYISPYLLPSSFIFILKLEITLWIFGEILKTSVSEGLVIEVVVVWLVQTPKPVDMIILPTIATKNQHVSDPTVGANNKKFSVVRVYLGLERGKVWFNVLL